MTDTIFNQIAPRYDFLNRLLSFGLDQSWRKHVVQFLPSKSNLQILDVATGTADLPILMLRKCQRVTWVTGIDKAVDMLQIGHHKIEDAALDACIDLQTGDAHHLPFSDNSFDAVTVAFGLRNMHNKPQALLEMMRVLRPEGRLIVLEFSMPHHPIIRALYLFYFRHILPLVGGIISGHYKAYRYLNQSVENFSCPELAAMKAHALCFGIATIYFASKIS